MTRKCKINSVNIDLTGAREAEGDQKYSNTLQSRMFIMKSIGAKVDF